MDDAPLQNEESDGAGCDATLCLRGRSMGVSCGGHGRFDGDRLACEAIFGPSMETFQSSMVAQLDVVVTF
jgi:hypothetical protein